jgi:DNA-directed RNA polymerase subunit alpha
MFHLSASYFKRFMIPLPSTPKMIEKKGNKATFEIAGLYPGYGVTIGNSLRRVLLSSMEGAAITQVKMKDVQHEFSTISGVLEDVLRIILNLKQVRCKLYGDESQKIQLRVKGEKEVKAGDFETPTQVEIANKDAHIATITDRNKTLEIEALVEKGIGYVPAEQHKKGKLEIGTIVLDAIFTPVKRVAFRVENMRVGERTDYDRLFLEIETDGTLTPEEALRQASEILANHFIFIGEAFPKQTTETTSQPERGEKKRTSKTKEKAGKEREQKKKSSKKKGT